MEIEGKNEECTIRMQINVENQFDHPGIWLKGNLHCHPDSGYNPDYSIVSPKRLCEDYLAKGFDFLASTDYHFKEQTNLAVNGGVNVSHLAEQQCTTQWVYSRDRPGCQFQF
jgi:hypothetical protein